MPTIKTKKEMNLGELLCWAIDNKEQARFRDFSSKNMRVRFNDSVKPEIIFDKQFLPIQETFTVEIEEEITGDTVIPRILEIGVGCLSGYSAVEENVSINRIINKKNKYIYIIGDDYAITLFYRDGKLV